jgi:hypothetical protein
MALDGKIICVDSLFGQGFNVYFAPVMAGGSINHNPRVTKTKSSSQNYSSSVVQMLTLRISLCNKRVVIGVNGKSVKQYGKDVRDQSRKDVKYGLTIEIVVHE